MFPFPDGFIFSERVGRLLPLETICGRLTQRPMSSLAGSPEQLRFTSFAFADLDNLQGLPFEPGFRPRSAPALVRGSEVSHNCCLPRGRDWRGAKHGARGPAEPAGGALGGSSGWGSAANDPQGRHVSEPSAPASRSHPSEA